MLAELSYGRHIHIKRRMREPNHLVSKRCNLTLLNHVANEDKLDVSDSNAAQLIHF